jgi:L-lactate dehydrogenase complex protein LldG
MINLRVEYLQKSEHGYHKGKGKKMSSREEILGRLRPLARSTPHPQPWQSQRQFPDLAARFTESLTAVLGEVIRAANLDEAWQKLGDLLHQLEAESIVANAEHPITRSAATQLPNYLKWHILGQTDTDWKTACETADVGLTSAEAAFAETGSIVVSSGANTSRMVSLLPPVHIAMVPESKLTADIFTWTAARKGSLPANTVFVSGPSKTADIEMTLVKGVHGPKRFIVILYGD